MELSKNLVRLNHPVVFLALFHSGKKQYLIEQEIILRHLKIIHQFS